MAKLETKTRKKPAARTKKAAKTKVTKAKGRGSAKLSSDQVAPAAQLMSTLDLYFQEVKAYSLLTRAEECELARGIHSSWSRPTCGSWCPLPRNTPITVCLWKI